MPSTMFWKFDLHTSSHLEALLDKEDVTLAELMDEEDVLQECKAQNRRSVCLICIQFIQTWFGSVISPGGNRIFVSIVDEQASPVSESGPVYAGAGPSDHHRASYWCRRSQAL